MNIPNFYENKNQIITHRDSEYLGKDYTGINGFMT